MQHEAEEKSKNHAHMIIFTSVFLHPNSFQLIFIYQVIMQFKYLVLFAAWNSVKLHPRSYAVTFGIYTLFYCTRFMLVDRQTHLA